MAVQEVQALACSTCELQRSRAESLLIDLENAEIQMRTMRREIGRLKGELARERAQDPQMDAAERVFEYWRKRLRPNAKAFGADRQKAVLGRLNEGRTEVELKQAIEGARIGAFTDEKGKRHDDLELICRSDRYVLRFIDIFERASAEAERRKRFERCVAYAQKHADFYGLLTEDDVHDHAEQMLATMEA